MAANGRSVNICLRPMFIVLSIFLSLSLVLFNSRVMYCFGVDINVSMKKRGTGAKMMRKNDTSMGKLQLFAVHACPS